MDRTTPAQPGRQTHDNREPGVPPSPPRHPDEEAPCKSDRAHESAKNQPSCPPLRRDASTYGGPDQPAWLGCFIRGELTPDLDFSEIARGLWTDFGGAEDLESWLAIDENREEARYFASGGIGIDTYKHWCFRNAEPGALLWLLEKKNENSFTLDFEKFRDSGDFAREDLGIWLEALATDVNIRALSLDNVVLDLERAMLLRSCLNRKKDLVSLDIKGLQFIDADICPVIHLAQGIASAIGLKTLTMQRCGINGADWTVIMEMIKDHPTLESLHIVKSEITTEDLITILQNTRANPRIQELGFYTLTLPPAGATVIAESLAKDASLGTLKIVNAGLDGASGGIIADALAGNSTLTELNLASNRLDAEFATACRYLLEHNRRLECLDLNENELGDQGAEAIANGLRKNQALHFLALDQNGIQERGGLALAGMLAVNTALAELRMADNSCGEKAGKAMADALAGNTTLQYLGDDGCGFSEQARASIETINNRNNLARASKVRDAMLFSRHGGAASRLPPEIGGLIMNHLLMQSATNEQYQSAATAIELALNAMTISPQEKSN